MRRQPNRTDVRPTARAAAGAIVLVALVAQGCTYHSAFIRYDEFPEVALQPESFTGENLGLVMVKEGGAIWRECTEVARGTIWLLLDEARRRGGNAIGDIRWMPQASARRIDRPTCRRRWGFFLIWPIVATPAFMAANAEGVVYRVDSTSADTAGLFLLPESEEETSRLVETILMATGVTASASPVDESSQGEVAR